MPMRPLRGCKHPLCPELVSSGFCVAHLRAKRATQDARRGSATSRGYDERWRRARASFLASHPLCVECEAEGRVTAATVVDHVVSIRVAPHRRLDPTNLRAMCKPHHDARTMRDQVPRGRV